VRELTSRIDIDASPERVWAVLADFAAYPEWNPFTRKIVGSLQPGSRLDVRIAPPGGRAMTFKPSIHGRAEPGDRVARALGCSRHLRRGASPPARAAPVRGHDFTQRERFSGIIVPLTGSTLEKTERGFEEMNAALKQRAEQHA